MMEQARELELNFCQHQDIGDLKVGATMSIGNYLAIQIMARFSREHESARVSLEVANTTTIAAKVRNFTLDIGLIEGECNEPELRSYHGAKMNSSSFAPPTILLPGKKISPTPI